MKDVAVVKRETLNAIRDRVREMTGRPPAGRPVFEGEMEIALEREARRAMAEIENAVRERDARMEIKRLAEGKEADE